MRKFLSNLLIILLTLNCLSVHAQQEKNWEQKIPQDLKKWLPWVTRNIDISECSIHFNDASLGNLACFLMCPLG